MPDTRRGITFTLQAPTALVAGALLFCSGCSRKVPEQVESPLPGTSVVIASASGGVDRQRLETMLWQDIAPTAETTLSLGLISEVMAASDGSEASPCRYLRGLLELSSNHPEEASNEWAAIPLEDFPPDFLYAPWRVAESTAKDANRYTEPLTAAVTDNKTSPLVTARWHGGHGAFNRALSAYLKSDPAQWTPHELEQLRVMKLYQPLTSEVTRMVAGALKGGRIPKALQADFLQLLQAPAEPDKEQVTELLKSDPVVARAAVEGARRQLDLRQAFASDRFEDVVAQTRNLDTATATDETVLLAFLASTRTGEKDLASRWAEELLRRKPGSETETWIQNIQQSSP
ncbi:hypothetical protein HNR46_001126 [Haloferula luteola]|uniref:Uncharacterized protein n=1 Tax=Haloferula luteola TaxID=595692 RepID=A0A840UYN5_9BACT|nr:hypothetical protein [Haloferula luteola]MBB5350892.1 hypothetical protein [Haloferula luteola]